VPPQIAYAALFFIDSQSDDVNTVHLIRDLCARIRPASASAELTGLITTDLPEDLNTVITAVFLLPETLLGLFIESLAKRGKGTDWSLFAAACIAPLSVIQRALLDMEGTHFAKQAAVVLIGNLLCVATPIVKRRVQSMTKSQYRLATLLSSKVMTLVEALAYLPSDDQIRLLKFIRYMACVINHVLTEVLGIIRGFLPARVKFIIKDLKARREFAKLTTGCVRAALASPGIGAIVKRCVDTWVGVYSSALEESVKFIEIELHLRFAMTVSSSKIVKYPTGSFWFAILVKLVDWDRIDFLGNYFETIIGNGVMLHDSQVIVQFVNEMKEDETLMGKLSVLKVIVVLLKGNSVLREALAETYETLGPLVEVVDRDDSLFDAILEALTDPD
jgi:hypothetical protein